MSEAAFDVAARLLSEHLGLRIDSTLRSRLAGAVRDEAARHRQDPVEYVANVEADPEMLQGLLNRVTVQETAFFRDPGQFAALAADVLPELRDADRPVRAWSAGCANGQEAYSLAIALDESGIEDWHVIASDISTAALDRTKRGRYVEKELTGLSPSRRTRYLVPARDDATAWEVVPELRHRVRAVQHNLVAEPPPFPPGGCEIVFCRNVLIYFDRANVLALIDRLAEWLPQDGYLFLGYSESLWQLSDSFRLVRLSEAFAYRHHIDQRTLHAPPGGLDDAAREAEPTTRQSSRDIVGDTGSGNSVARAWPAPATHPPAGPTAPRPISVSGTAPSGTRSASTRAAERRADPMTAGDDLITMTASEALIAGELALGENDHPLAIESFRQAIYLEPDNPVAYLNLGLALDASGDLPAAKRAFLAGRAALDRCDLSAVEAALEGYHIDELTRFLELRAES